MIEQLSQKLKKNDFHGGYFDRTAKPSDRMCDKAGWFQCEGPFDSKQCDKYHTINPYASKGYRQLFGLWNLDHMYVYHVQIGTSTGLDNKIFERRIVNIFLPITFNICLGAQKNRLIETVLLSTHNICFG